MDISGVAAVITGGASGLGGATASRLAKAGAKVTIFDLNETLGAEHAARIGATFIKVDIVSETEVTAALDQAERLNGAARILINCAGMAPPSKVISRDGQPLPLSEFRRTIDVNLIGSFNVLSKFAARICDSEPIGEERGVIVNTASVAAFEGQIGQAAYSASKAGLVGLGLPVAREFARYGIRVTTIAPGIFMTPLLASLPQEAQDSLGKQVPFPSRLGKPEEFAQLAETIIVNPMLNGEVIRLDGAIRMAPK